MGTYAVLFPNAPIQSLFLILPVQIRARSWLALWFVSQFFIDRNARVAWAAHVGGFVFGVVVGLIMRARRPRSASRPSGTPGVLRDPYAHEWVPRHY
jgi:membrane associated rhomboid family serine protease